MTFQASPAVRKAMPISLALFGASSSGKTYTMLRVLAGLERLTKKPTYVIDTEGDRALHYADDFKFHHVPFEPPFTSERYIEAVNYCIQQGAGQIGVDSGSHEWEGEGGVLERQWKTALRMARGDERRAEAMNQPAWAEVKEPHNALRICIQRTKVHQVWGFRAKEKNKVGKDAETKKQTITSMGFMPVGGTDLIFEFMLSALLLPGSRGVPTWQSEQRGEGVVIKVPKQFEKLCEGWKGPLSEDFGEAIGRWGAGSKQSPDKPVMSANRPVWTFNPGFEMGQRQSVATADVAMVGAYVAWLTQRKKAAHDAEDTAKEASIGAELARAESLFEEMQAEEALKGGAP